MLGSPEMKLYFAESRTFSLWRMLKYLEYLWPDCVNSQLHTKCTCVFQHGSVCPCFFGASHPQISKTPNSLLQSPFYWGLGRKLRWWNVCPARMEPWVRALMLHKTRFTGTCLGSQLWVGGDRMNQEFKVILIDIEKWEQAELHSTLSKKFKKSTKPPVGCPKGLNPSPSPPSLGLHE